MKGIMTGMGGWNGRQVIVLAVLAVVGLAARVILALPPAQLDGDMAVFALMAKHIAEGAEFPIYLWEAHYAGTLASYIGALFFKIFGLSSSVYLFVGVLFSCAWVAASALLLRRIGEGVPFLTAVALVALPPFMVLYYAQYPGGVHAENLLFSTLILLMLVLRDRQNLKENNFFCILLGATAGLGLWLSPAVFPALATVLAVFFLTDRAFFLSRRLILFVTGLLAGCVPAILYNLEHPGATLFRMGGRVLSLDRGVLSSPDAAGVIAGRILWRISEIPKSLLQIPGLTVDLMGWPAAILFLLSAGIVLHALCARGEEEFGSGKILITYVIAFTLFYSVFIGEREVRYVLSLYAVFPAMVLAAMTALGGRWKAVLAAAVVFVVLQGGFLFCRALPDRGPWDFRGLAAFMASNRILFGYSDYWAAYPVIFESKEAVILSPTLYHPTFSERRPEYTRRVREAPSAAYVINSDKYPLSAQTLEHSLAKRGISYRKERFKNFVIYCGLSERVPPGELSLPPR